MPSGGSIHPHVHEPISRIVSISPTSGGSAVTKTSLNFFATVYEKTSGIESQPAVIAVWMPTSYGSIPIRP